MQRRRAGKWAGASGPNPLWDVAGDSQRYDNFFCFENGPKSEGNTC